MFSTSQTFVSCLNPDRKYFFVLFRAVFFSQLCVGLRFAARRRPFPLFSRLFLLCLRSASFMATASRLPSRLPLLGDDYLGNAPNDLFQGLSIEYRSILCVSGMRRYPPADAEDIRIFCRFAAVRFVPNPILSCIRRKSEHRRCRFPVSQG